MLNCIRNQEDLIQTELRTDYILQKIWIKSHLVSSINKT